MSSLSISTISCHECNGTAFLVKDKPINLILPNPGSKTIISDCYECSQCSEEIFDENQSLAFAKKVDEIIASEKLQNRS